jgi:tripartite-type tricarboxylate transporter receptor subunit TctC
MDPTMNSSRMYLPMLSRRALLYAAAASALASPALADSSFPNRPLRLIVPFAPGGTGDIVARLLGNKLGEALGQTVVIDNRGGAGSILGTDAGAKAAPDGYTLTISNGAAITTGPLMGQRLTYKPLDDFVHLYLIGAFSNMLVVRVDHPAKNLKEFIEHSRKNSAGVSWGSAGVGSAGFLAGELLAQLAKAHMVHVPYKGTGPAMNDLLGGTLEAMLTSAAVAAPHIKSGKLRTLAVSSAERQRDFPEVPTMNETVPGAIGDAWFGVSLPARTPKPVVDRLYAALERAGAQPELRAQLQEAGLAPLALGPAEFDKFLRQENAKWGPVIRAAKITPE